MRRGYKFLANADTLAQPVPTRLYFMVYCVLNIAESSGRPCRATIAIILQITAILTVCMFTGACSLKHAPVAVDPLQWRKIDLHEKEESLIKKLDSINFGLAQFKGKGKLYVYKKGKLNLAERLFWICAAPNLVRLSVVGLSGMPLASFASDGKSMESKREMIAMTTSNSTRVKPSRSVFTSEPGQGRPVSDISVLTIKQKVYSTVTLFARFRGLSTSWPRSTAA